MGREDHPDLIEALEFINPELLDYGEWFSIGAALHNEGYDFEDWNRWLASSGSPKYKGPGPLMTHWRSFHDHGGITGATIAKLARDHGWSPSSEGTKATRKSGLRTIRLEDEVLTMVDATEVYAPPNPSLRAPVNAGQELDVGMLERYLCALFEPDDIVAWVSLSNEEHKPADKGYWKRRDVFIRDVRDGGIGKLYGDFQGGEGSDSGAWIRFNPMDGDDIKDSNVADFRYALVEADSGEPEQQQATMEAMRLPIMALTYSGGKSMHAIVAVDAATREEYRDRVNLLYAECKKAGLDVDTQNKNPARLSRMPGVARGDVMQRLIYTWQDKGDVRPTWDAWRAELAEKADTMPKTQSLRELIARTDCELAPELVEGVLRIGHKMMLSAPSKAGKSFLLMELCATIADGAPGAKWLMWQIPRRGRVLYVNLELDEPDCRQRFIDIYHALGIPVTKISDNLQILNLRGHGAPLDELAPFIVKRCEELAPLLAIVLDPMYKVSTGDENSAADMSVFCNALDVIAANTGASVIYSHHFIKTGFAQREAMARASGSGVFVRDGDALITLTPIDSDSDEYEAACARGRDGKALDNPRSGFVVHGNLRSFPEFKPFNIWFEHPIHYADEDGEIAKAQHRAKSNIDGLAWDEMSREQQAHAFNRACIDFKDDPDAIVLIAERFCQSRDWAKKRIQRSKAWETDGQGGIKSKPPLEQGKLADLA